MEGITVFHLLIYLIHISIWFQSSSSTCRSPDARTTIKQARITETQQSEQRPRKLVTGADSEATSSSSDVVNFGSLTAGGQNRPAQVGDLTFARRQSNSGGIRVTPCAKYSIFSNSQYFVCVFDEHFAELLLAAKISKAERRLAQLVKS